MGQPDRASATPPLRYVEVVEFCHQYARENGAAPSYSKIRQALRIEHDGTVRRYVKQAEAAGLITLGEFTGGRGDTVKRIRLGRPGEADTQRIRLGRDL